MSNQIDWDAARRQPFADVETPPDWPRDVKPLAWQGINLLGVDDRRNVYWDGQRLQTVAKLGWVERALATAVAVGTVSMAIVDLLRFVSGG